MKVKIVLIFLILALVLSACSYQVVEDRKTRTIHGFLPVALAEADTGPPEGERTLRKDIFNWFKTLFDTLKNVETEEKLPIEDEKAIEEIVPGKKREVFLLIPFSKGHLLSKLHSEHTILKEDYTAEGTRITCLLDAKTYAVFRDYVVEESRQ